MMNENWIVWLLAVILSSGVICCAILAFRRIFRGRVSPRVTALLWLLLVVRLAVPVTLSVPFHLPQARWPVVVEQESVTPGGEDTVARQPQVLTQHAQVERVSHAGGASGGVGSGIGQVPAARDHEAATARDGGAMVSWQQLLGIALATGTALFGIWTIWHAARQSRRYAACEVPVPRRVTDAVRQVAASLGLRRVPRVRVVSGICTPALTISVRPTLILPELLSLPGNPERLRLALLHELTHFRRGDHLLALLMCVLRVLWWFNPFAWIGFAFARRDMEAACDSLATGHLARKERAEYARMLVDLATGDAPEPVLGMSRRSHARLVEDRIRRMYGPRRTRGSVRATAIVLSGVLGIACFTTACYPVQKEAATVTDEGVVPSEAVTDTSSSKDKELLSATSAPISTGQEQDAIAAGPAPYVAGSHWTEDAELRDGLRFRADLDMMVPDVDAFPVEKVQMLALTQEGADALITALAGEDATFWSARGPSRADLEEEAREIEELIAEHRADGDEETVQTLQDDLEQVRSQMEDLATGGSRQRTDTSFTYWTDRHTGEPVVSQGMSTIDVIAKGADGRIAVVSAERSDPDAEESLRDGGRFLYQEGPYQCQAWDETQLETLEDTRAECRQSSDADWIKEQMAWIEEEGDSIQQRMSRYRDDRLDLEAAALAARSQLEALGINGLDMTMCSPGLLDPYEEMDEADWQSDVAKTQVDPRTSQPVAVMRFARGMNGVAGLNDGNIGIGDPSAQLVPDVAQEELKLAIDADGRICALEWYDPVLPVETVSTDSDLMPEEEIRERADEMLRDWATSQADGYVDREPMTAVVEDAELGVAYMPAQDNPSQMLVVPAWRFQVVLKADEEHYAPEGKGGRLAQEIAFGTLVLNAIDGTPLVSSAYAE